MIVQKYKDMLSGKSVQRREVQRLAMRMYLTIALATPPCLFLMNLQTE